MTKSRLSLLALILSASLGLAACDSAEERAEGHYKAAVELLEAGDVDRAIVEFRNVFQLNGRHMEARRLYAETMRKSGNLREAFGSYLLVSEQDPNDVTARLSLARMAFETQNWDELEQHGSRAFEMAPENDEARLFHHIIAYRQAVLSQDAPARREAARQIADLRAARPQDTAIFTVLIDNLIQDGDYEQALQETDAALLVDPASGPFLQGRLALLNQLGRDDLYEEQLTALVRDYPSNVNYTQMLIRWYASRGENAKAEEILKAVATKPDAGTDARVGYVQFVQQTRGADAAREIIAELIESGMDVEILRALRAGLDFDEGKRDEAISALEDLLATSEPSSRTRDVKIALARMLNSTGNTVAARQRVEEVLAEDPSHVEALKMRAAWLVDQDKPDDAIIALRSALGQAPQDAQLMTLMASAYLRAGNRDLAGDMLSLAVDTTRSAPDAAVRYARFLMEDDKLSTAESVLIDSLRTAPGNQDVLVELGRVYLGQTDWPRLEQVEGTLRRLETEEGAATADGFRVARLRGQDRADEAIAYLESVIQEQGQNANAELAIVQTHLRNRDYSAAERFVDQSLASNPDNIVMKLLKAGIYATTDRLAEAEATYRGVLAESPQAVNAWQSLYAMMNRQGRAEEATAVLREGLAANPDAGNLQWALAGELEKSGDIDGAIAIYQSLYDRNSDSVIVANNLASLLSTYKTDDESLERAWSIARRLHGMDNPALQDTYGWIALRKGQTEEALQHLEPAAAGLPEDPIVQYHLAVAYEKAGRIPEAIERFRQAVDLAGPADTRQQFQTAREEIVRLSELPAAQPSK